jgi:hypothetical protein
MRDREKGTAVDYVGHFEREAAAFEAARFGEDDSQCDGQDDGPPGIQISGTASDLALFLWQRPVTGQLRNGRSAGADSSRPEPFGIRG